ncbi:hypothetical protein D3C72_1955200 [compost metagenome]
MTGHVQHVIDAAHDPEVAILIAVGGVAGEVVLTVELFREVGLLEAVGVVPDGAYQRRERLLDHQETALAGIDRAAGFIDDVGDDAW